MYEPQFINQKIKQARAEAGLTQEALARKADISHRFLAYVEADEKEVGVASLCRIAEATGKPLVWFLGENESVQPNAPDFTELRSRLMEAIEIIDRSSTPTEEPSSNVVPFQSPAAGRPNREVLTRLPSTRTEPTGEFNATRAKAANSTKKPQREKGEK